MPCVSFFCFLSSPNVPLHLGWAYDRSGGPVSVYGARRFPFSSDFKIPAPSIFFMSVNVLMLVRLHLGLSS